MFPHPADIMVTERLLEGSQVRQGPPQALQASSGDVMRPCRLSSCVQRSDKFQEGAVPQLAMPGIYGIHEPEWGFTIHHPLAYPPQSRGAIAGMSSPGKGWGEAIPGIIPGKLFCFRGTLLSVMLGLKMVHWNSLFKTSTLSCVI